MMALGARSSHLRVRREHEHARVSFVELFFDLVFVFAVTQLSHGLLAHLTPLGALQTAFLTLAVWWAWVYTTWVTNWVDPERAPVRLMLFALMLAGLVMSASIPKAFEDRALAFAASYAFIQVGRSVFMLWALAHHDARNFRNFVRITAWLALAAPFWIGGAFVDGGGRLGIWAIALAIEYAAPICGFFVPGLGRSSTTDWAVEGTHMAERCGLFIIIALGESILLTGATFAGMAWTAEHVGAFLVAFAGSVTLWVLYFNIGAERASRQIASSDDPGRLARNGYTYIHILIVAGIILVAVGDELVLHHPAGRVEPRTAIVLIAGPAVYLAGNMLFKWLSAAHLPLSHIAGVILLALLIPVAGIATPLILSACTAAVLIVVAGWEWISLRPAPSSAGR